jgi:hypothetical protein
LQDSYKVEGPACNSAKTQRLFKEIATVEPWISDPTAVDACTRGEPRHEPGARVHGGPHRRGTPPNRSQLPVLDHTVLIVRERDAAVGTPERPVAWQRLAGVTSGRRSRPPKRPRVGAMRSGATCARDRGVKGDARASSTAGAGRGRRGCSGKVARATVRPLGKKKWAGKVSHHA